MIINITDVDYESELLHTVQQVLEIPSINPNILQCNDMSLFTFACKSRNIELVKFLLEDSRLDPNKSDENGNTPLHIMCDAIKNYHRALIVIRLLLEDDRVDPNKQNNRKQTAFHIACKRGRYGIIKIFIEDGRIDINKADSYGFTPFYVACETGNF